MVMLQYTKKLRTACVACNIKQKELLLQNRTGNPAQITRSFI